MPAIQLTRLNRQIAELSEAFHQPKRFLRVLHDVLEAYHDRSYRAGQTNPPLTRLPHYHLPLPVIKAVENEIRSQVQEDPQAGLLLADELWADAHLETRRLAVLVLGLVPLTPPDPVIDRFTIWASPDEDRQILQSLLTQGAARLIREKPELWARLTRDWLASLKPAVQSMGLQALLATVKNPSYEDLPAAYRLISPLVHAPPARLQGDLLEILKALAQRSPRETAFFLRQILTINATPDFLRLFRRCLPFFEEEAQASLRSALHTIQNA